jgi:hypothetical protein
LGGQKAREELEQVLKTSLRQDVKSAVIEALEKLKKSAD